MTISFEWCACLEHGRLIIRDSKVNVFCKEYAMLLLRSRETRGNKQKLSEEKLLELIHKIQTSPLKSFTETSDSMMWTVLQSNTNHLNDCTPQEICQALHVPVNDKHILAVIREQVAKRLESYTH